MGSMTPDFIYRMAGVEEELNADSNLCSLPLDRENSSFSLWAFFESATIFLQKDDYRGLKHGFSFYNKENTPCSEIVSIEICIEKHGAFYHPARVSVLLKSKETFLFVLNSAVSAHGVQVMDNEVKALEKLAGEVPSVLLPRVFASGKIASDRHGRNEVSVSTTRNDETSRITTPQEAFHIKGGNAAFFLAQWFDGFLEFHISGSLENQHLSLWKSDGSSVALSAPDYFEIYEQATEILTRLYNLETFEQVFPWHHAAGDFVVKPVNGGFDLRMITVRNYDSMLGCSPDSEDSSDLDMEDINKALLLFFLNLSLRMRIDRIDGTGEFCLIDESIIPHMVKGFFRGLASKTFVLLNGWDLCRIFLNFTKTFDSIDLAEILGMTVASYNPNAPEIFLLKKNLQSHARLLVSQLGEMGKKSFFIDKAL